MSDDLMYLSAVKRFCRPHSWWRSLKANLFHSGYGHCACGNSLDGESNLGIMSSPHSGYVICDDCYNANKEAIEKDNMAMLRHWGIYVPTCVKCGKKSNAMVQIGSGEPFCHQNNYTGTQWLNATATKYMTIDPKWDEQAKNWICHDCEKLSEGKKL